MRPEAIALGPQGASEASNRLTGTVDSLLFNGANSRVLVRSPSGALLEVDSPALDTGMPARPGDAVDLTFAHARTLCFPAAARP